MTTEPIDVTSWPRSHADEKHPVWWGVIGLLAIAVNIVAIFLVGFFYLWMVNIAEERMGWPPQGTQLPPAFIPGVELALLALCAAAVFYGGKVLHRGLVRRFIWAMVVCCSAAAAVHYFRWLQFQTLPFSLGENAYASFVWVLTGYHLLHVAIGLLMTAILGWLAARGYALHQWHMGAKANAMHWYFTALAWTPIYCVLYWMPRWAQ